MSDEIRVGDEFEIRVKVVAGSGDNMFRCHAVGAPDDYFNVFSPGVLLAGRRIPRPIAVGGWVAVKEPASSPTPKGKVEWTDGTDALVRWFNGPAGLVIEDLSDLTPIPGDQP